MIHNAFCITCLMLLICNCVVSTMKRENWDAFKSVSANYCRWLFDWTGFLDFNLQGVHHVVMCGLKVMYINVYSTITFVFINPDFCVQRVRIIFQILFKHVLRWVSRTSEYQRDCSPSFKAHANQCCASLWVFPGTKISSV